MRAINHALTGALIGLVVQEPAVAVPAAVASHFVCDALPHFGPDLPELKNLRSRQFRNLLIIDGCLCFALVIILGIQKPEHWLLAAICAFAAASPDLISINRFLKAKQHRVWKGSAYTHFANNIQWFERPIGAAVELAWLTGTIILIWPFLR